MAKRGKKYQDAAKKIDRTKKYELSEAVELAKATSVTKFDGTVELAFKMNLDSRKAEQNLRGAIVLPYGTGKTRSVLVLTNAIDNLISMYKSNKKKIPNIDGIIECYYELLGFVNISEYLKSISCCPSATS